MKTIGKRDYALDNEYSLRTITNLDEFRKLQTVWNDIAFHENSFFPFLCFEWFEVWLEHFLNRNKLLILSVYKGDTLLAIAPLIIKEEKFKGIYVKKIELIGNVYSHIRNLILHGGDDTAKGEVLLTIFNHLINSYDWDIMDLSSIPEEKFDFKILYQILDKIEIKRKENFCFGNWYLDNIDFSGNQYIRSRNTNIRNNIKRYRKHLETLGRLEFTVITNGSDEHINKFMDYYYIVYNNSWKKKETDPTFHRDVANFAHKKGWLRLGFLFLNNNPVAAQFWLVYGGNAHILKLVYDENYKKFIPGIILTSEMMKYAIDIDKVREIDFGVGDDPHKKDWTPNRRERKGVVIFNKNIKAKFLFFLVDKALPVMNQYNFARKFKGILKNRFMGSFLVNHD